MTITYKLDNNIYINLTNRCSNDCKFCLRNNGDFGKYNLWLEKEPSAREVIAELGNLEGIEEVVFCGYGEPLYRLDAIIEISQFAHDKGVKTRLNTNGQASLIIGEGVAKRLQGSIDTVSISLNATTAEQYQEICQSIYGTKAFVSMLDFARECKDYIPSVVLSVVDIIGSDEIAKSQAIADSLGIKLRIRNYIET